MQRIYEISIEFRFVFRSFRAFAKLTRSSFKFNFNVISRAALRITKLPDRIEYRIFRSVWIILFVSYSSDFVIQHATSCRLCAKWCRLCLIARFSKRNGLNYRIIDRSSSLGQCVLNWISTAIEEEIYYQEPIPGIIKRARFAILGYAVLKERDTSECTNGKRNVSG